ncbi:MAG: hypothetical protein M3Y33_02360 [Actinomycetota bacterium]|nr:hypothetical protein [Actinomycetota bacterium]
MHRPRASGLRAGPLVVPDAIICLTGISPGTRTVTTGLDQANKEMVLENTPGGCR